MASTDLGGQWSEHIEVTLADFQSRGLLRYLRPVLPSVDAVKVGRRKADIGLWAENVHVSFENCHQACYACQEIPNPFSTSL